MASSGNSASEAAPTTTQQEAAVAAEDATESAIDPSWEFVREESSAASIDVAPVVQLAQVPEACSTSPGPIQISQNAAVAAEEAELMAAEDATIDKLRITVEPVLEIQADKAAVAEEVDRLAAKDPAVDQFLHGSRDDLGVDFVEDCVEASKKPRSWAQQTEDADNVGGLELVGKPMGSRGCKKSLNKLQSKQEPVANHDGGGSGSVSSAVSANATVVAENAHPPPHPNPRLAKAAPPSLPTGTAAAELLIRSRIPTSGLLRLPRRATKTPRW